MNLIFQVVEKMLRTTTSRLLRCNQAFLSTAAEPKLKLEEFRTTENNPLNHNENHLGKFYKISEETRNVIFKHGGLTKTYEKQLKTFGETCLMIRKPAIDIMNYVRNTDFTKPINRYVLYGELGTGKSKTISHLLHFAHASKYLIVHVPWIPYWFKNPKDFGPSPIYEGMTDLPINAAAWLVHFKTQNLDLLKSLDLKITKEYVWTKRETTPAGAQFLELIDHGINRAKFACEVIKVLLDEIKIASSSEKVTTFVAIDGFNNLFYEHTNLRGKFNVMIPSHKITLRQPFLDIVNHDWNNGFVVLTVDRLAQYGWKRESNLPLYLLTREGFEHLDPFLPIKMDNYDAREYESCIEYYVNRKWIQNVGEGFEKELEFLTNKNPYVLMDYCKAL